MIDKHRLTNCKRDSLQVSGIAFRGGSSKKVNWDIAEETPISIFYNDSPFGVMMVSPNDLFDYAVGFSLSEGLVNSKAEVLQVKLNQRDEGIELKIEIPERRLERLQIKERRRNLTGRTGCGLCGLNSLSHVFDVPNKVISNYEVCHRVVAKCCAQLSLFQPLNKITRSVHGAFFSDLKGKVHIAAEDIGRHNALDKMIGKLVNTNLLESGGFSIVTSRCSYELVQKAARCGISILVSISAPTALAIQMAEAWGITLCAFNKGEVVAWTAIDRLV